MFCLRCDLFLLGVLSCPGSIEVAASGVPGETPPTSLHYNSDGDLPKAGHSYMFPTLALDWAEAVAECEVS